MTKPELHLIVAMAEDGAIGFQGDMPWGRGLPADLKHFKETTMGFPIVMGRKTFESLKNGALPGRTNIVVTRNTDYSAPNAVVVHSVHEALEEAAREGAEKIFLIGGGELYHQGLEEADVLHITLVHHKWPNADTFFPKINLDYWACVETVERPADERNLFDISFTRWEKQK